MVLVTRCFRGIEIIEYRLDVGTDISVPRSILAGQKLGARRVIHAKGFLLGSLYTAV